MEFNARVDKVGKDHMGGHIYKVTIGDQEPLYLSDARLELGNPVVTTVLTVGSHKHSGMSSSIQAITTGAEPDIRGNLTGGLSKEWIDWYRRRYGALLKDALAERRRRLSLLPGN